MRQNMVKIDLITGFLGSGKTTFIKKYGSYLMEKGENLGILENDFEGGVVFSSLSVSAYNNSISA